MKLGSRGKEQNAAQKPASSLSTTKGRRFRGLRSLLSGKEQPERRAGQEHPSCDRSSHNTADEHPSVDHVDVVSATCDRTLSNSYDPSTQQLLWERAYSAFKEEKRAIAEEYEKLLFKELQMESPTDPGPSNDPATPFGDPGAPRQAQLDMIIAQGLQRLDEKKMSYTIAGHEYVAKEQVAKAAALVLWAKAWVGEAVKASPEASIVWAGVCVVLPLLTNAHTADEANRDGFTYVTTRMDYYAALEPVALRLSKVPAASDRLIAQVTDHMVALYRSIIEFQIRSVLRFYQNRLAAYVKDIVMPEDWKQMRANIEKLDAMVKSDLSQINEFAAREDLESLDQTSKESLGIMESLLSVSEQQLQLIGEHRDIASDHRDIAQKHLDAQAEAAKQQEIKKQQECLQLFRLTANDKDITYEWYKRRIEARVQGTCLWFVEHEKFQQWLGQELGPLLVSADPGCGKSVMAKYLIDHVLPRSAAICYFFFKDGDQNTVRQALCAILHQLFSQRPYLLHHATDSFCSNGEQLIHSTYTLWSILWRALKDPAAGPVIIVLDALDECDENEFEHLLSHVVDHFESANTDTVKLRFLFKPPIQSDRTTVYAPVQSLFILHLYTRRGRVTVD